jgi:hypothetical protein
MEIINMTKHLLYPIVRGTVKYVRVTQETLREYCEAMNLSTEPPSFPYSYADATSIEYIFPEVLEWLVNRELAKGKILIGSDGLAWIMTDPENT